jgi:hypothetical protein
MVLFLSSLFFEGIESIEGAKFSLRRPLGLSRRSGNDLLRSLYEIVRV